MKATRHLSLYDVLKCLLQQNIVYIEVQTSGVQASGVHGIIMCSSLPVLYAYYIYMYSTHIVHFRSHQETSLFFPFLNFVQVELACAMALTRGENLYLTLGGGQILRKFGKLQAPKARSCDCRRQEAPHDYRGSGPSGERPRLPSGVWGRAPEADVILNISSQNEVNFGILVISHFLNN